MECLTNIFLKKSELVDTNHEKLDGDVEKEKRKVKTLKPTKSNILFKNLRKVYHV